jgi:hypothetical protein
VVSLRARLIRAFKAYRPRWDSTGVGSRGRRADPDAPRLR